MSAALDSRRPKRLEFLLASLPQAGERRPVVDGCASGSASTSPVLVFALAQRRSARRG